MMTLGEFIVKEQAQQPHATGEFTSLLSSIRLAAKVVNRETNKAGLADVIGGVGSLNKSGEAQQKLDVFANEVFKLALEARGEVCGIASEEEEGFVTFENVSERSSKYVVLIDPLDGSSNIDVNVSIGTIFSIYRRTSSATGPVVLEDFLQPGHQQVAAGYIVYGASTMLVYTTGRGVNGFTYDPSLGCFCLSHPMMKIPSDGGIYSINEGNYAKFHTGVKQFIKYCQEIDATTNRPYTLRYIGSLVADFHRNLIKGGIYIYPAGTNAPEGKLRLLYECNPMAFLIEQAGGRASDGYRRILDIKPNALHQRTPFFVGSISLVETAEGFLQQADDEAPSSFQKK